MRLRSEPGGLLQEGGTARTVVDWLSRGAIHLAPMGRVYGSHNLLE